MSKDNVVNHINPSSGGCSTSVKYEDEGGHPINQEEQIEGATRKVESVMDGQASLIRDFVDVLNKHGEWDDGCFYYNGVSASEFERFLRAK